MRYLFQRITRIILDNSHTLTMRLSYHRCLIRQVYSNLLDYYSMGKKRLRDILNSSGFLTWSFPGVRHSLERHKIMICPDKFKSFFFF